MQSSEGAVKSNESRAPDDERSQENDTSVKHTVDRTYLEHEPTVWETVKELAPTASSAAQYFRNLFPCIGWVPRYNWQWLLGDCIAGLTVGLVVIPQAMAYALLATLSPDFGLYTSFAGAATYWLFGTSKDIVIGVCRAKNQRPCVCG